MRHPTFKALVNVAAFLGVLAAFLVLVPVDLVGRIYVGACLAGVSLGWLVGGGLRRQLSELCSRE